MTCVLFSVVVDTIIQNVECTLYTLDCPKYIMQFMAIIHETYMTISI